MRLQPGSTLWLLAHELRLDWRRRTQRRAGRRSALWLSALVPVFLMVFIGLPLGRALRRYEVVVDPASALLAGLGLAAYFTLMLSQALAAAAETLYQRGDLDLLFSSPVSPRRVITVRFLAIAFSAFSVFGFFTAPPLAVIAMMGHPTWLAAIGVIFALALGATAVAAFMAAGLLRWVGASRTRTVAHILAALIGALFFLLTQLRTMLGGDRTENLSQAVAELAQSPAFRAIPGLDWPLRALLGEPWPLLAVIGVGCALLALAIVGLGPGFAADMANAAGAERPRRRRQPSRAFVTGAFPAALEKELRLIFRDPTLLTQVLARVLYLLPLGLLALREGAGHHREVLAGAAAGLVFMANQVAGSLAWIAISAEEAPELLASAPVTTRLIQRAKIAAVALVVSTLLAPVLAPLIFFAPLAGLAAAAGCAAAVLSASAVNLRWQRPVKRSEFRNRRNTSWFVTLVELGLGLLIATATALFASGNPWGAFPAAVALGCVLEIRRREGRPPTVAQADA